MPKMFSNIDSILVIKLRHIGDVLLTVPVFRALKETFPGARVSALVNAGTGDVLKGSPFVDEIIVVDRKIKLLSAGARLSMELRFLKSISKKGFDMTVDLTGGDRAAVLSFVSGAKYRIGPKFKKGFWGKRRLYTHLATPDRLSHTVLQNLSIVNQFGIDTDDQSVDFHPCDEDRDFIRKLFAKSGIKRGAAIVHVHPTSRWLFKCWKDEYMAEIIRWLLDKGIVVAITSSPDKREMEKAGSTLNLIGSRDGLVDLRGTTTIQQLGALSEASKLFFGVDSAPMHIAAAVGTPVVALFGPSGAFHWGPWDNRLAQFKAKMAVSGTPYSRRNGVQSFGVNAVIQRDWACIPCGKDGCAGSKQSKCLDDIRPSEIKALIEERLKEGDK
ncbi:MAG: putative lipopolysaccharide heptosyltransferase III [Dissulfurispiraceae bacterium]